MPEYRRHLPHIHPGDAWLFLTWCLHRTIPEQPAATPAQTEGQRFVALDRALDGNLTAPRWLRDSRIAAVAAAAILAGERDRRYYELFAWVVMPNHVHLLVTPLVRVPLVTGWLKGSTSRHANQILGRMGQAFWQSESYDHYARGPAERDRIADYIEMNPVRARLVDKPEDFRWSSAWTG